MLLLYLLILLLVFKKRIFSYIIYFVKRLTLIFPMNKSIVVVGDVILDRYIYGRVKRLNPESPTPLLSCEREEWKLGGAANVAANIASL